MNKLKEFLIEEIKEYEWDKIDGVIKSIIPNIIFTVDKNESAPSLLSSRFGGKPATPVDFDWPIQTLGQKAPLAFFFQLNFAEIKPFDIENKFPDKGILLCFASVTDDIMWEYDAPDAFKTYFFTDTENLILSDIPNNIPDEQRLSSKTINFKSCFQLPFYPFNYTLSDQGLISEDDADGIDEVAGEILSEAIHFQMRTKKTTKTSLISPTPKNELYRVLSCNMLLGVPFSVQDAIAEKWAEKHHNTNDLRENYVNLISFEMKGHEGYGFNANGAHLYLCLDKEDLENGNLNNITAIVQNT
ncbi:DUF1963 domain-containing protein [Aquimarina sediminis]|uniref:DUF1963 domain-containing protein n=1 Tax=Aquimarina sediminis TaxID=2070536 RepID=UPI000CA04A86|nr:DUF1963 domain-containing protein [Aquimarina sediminis]